MKKDDPKTHEITLVCGHTKQTLGKPEAGIEAFCWEWGCLAFQPIIEATPVSQ
jgi:hypothetical protein